MPPERSLALAVCLALGVGGCLRFDGETGLDGYCFDVSSQRYVFCDAGVGDAAVHTDASPADAGPMDAESLADATLVDMGFVDSGVQLDGASFDTGIPVDPDAGMQPDATPMDMGISDSGVHQQRIIEVRMDGRGGGTVTSVPPGLNCTYDPANGQSGLCRNVFAATSTVILGVALASNQDTFVGWGGDCAPSAAVPFCHLDVLAPGHRLAVATIRRDP